MTIRSVSHRGPGRHGGSPLISTTDQEAAKAFYSGLFGWEADDMSVGDGTVYSMMRLNGHHVAAISPQPEQQREPQGAVFAIYAGQFEE